MTPVRCSLCHRPPPARGCPRCELRALADAGLVAPDPPAVRARHRALEADRHRRDARRRQLARQHGAVRIALVGCGRAKRPGRHPARLLYTGSLFRAALQHAQRTAHETFVLSAKHGLVELDQVLEHYDARLPLQHDDRRLWGKGVECSLRLMFVGVPLAVAIYAGAAYADPVRDAARTNLWHITEPLRGLGLGARLQWFATRRRRQATQLALTL